MDSLLYETHASMCVLKRGQVLARAGEVGSVWQVHAGVLVLREPSLGGGQAVQLALPGDLVGAEALCGECYAFDVTTLLPSSLFRVRCHDEVSTHLALQRAYQQQRQRQGDMLQMRSGTVRERLQYLLRLLTDDGHAPVGLARHELPTLRVMAGIVGSTIETVCRELNTLTQRESAKVFHMPAFGDSAQRLRAVA